jgi:hypothetical protein
MSLRHLLAVCALCSLALGGQARSADAAAGVSGGGPDVTQTLLGILGYTRWPAEPNPLRLCVAGRSAAGDRLLHQGLEQPSSRPVVVRKMPEADIALQCDALYVGTLDEAAWRRIFTAIVDRAVLTVCERSPGCAASGMISLNLDDGARVQFEVNLDLVARSAVRINPQVLRLGTRPPARAVTP